MVNNFLKAAAVSAVAIFGAGAASAATTITTQINFDQGVQSPASGGSVIWDGYLVSPTNINSGQCEDGDCTLESGNGPLPMITRNADTSLFDFNRFWFSMQGTGGVADNLNSFYVEGFNKDNVSVKKLTFTINDSLGTFTDYAISFKLGEGGTGSNDNDCKTIKICKGVGYAVTLGSVFDNLSKVTFQATSTANTRLDTFELERMTPVPLPAAGWMLLAGVGGLAAMRRRKKRS